MKILKASDKRRDSKSWAEVDDEQVERIHRASVQMIDSGFAMRSVIETRTGDRIRGHIVLGSVAE